MHETPARTPAPARAPARAGVDRGRSGRWRAARALSGLLLAAVLGLLVAGPAWAQPRPPPRRPAPSAQRPEPVPDRIHVEVMALNATNAHDRVDERLAPLEKHLRLLPYKGFELMARQDEQVGVGQDHTFTLDKEHKVQVDLLSRDAKRARLRLRFTNKKGTVMDTVINVHRNKTFMVAVSGASKDEAMILPITARY